jgi:hypothetical protein
LIAKLTSGLPVGTDVCVVRVGIGLAGGDTGSAVGDGELVGAAVGDDVGKSEGESVGIGEVPVLKADLETEGLALGWLLDSGAEADGAGLVLEANRGGSRGASRVAPATTSVAPATTREPKMIGTWQTLTILWSKWRILRTS